MKILIPVSGIGRAGGYRVLCELASHWVKLGCEVDFLMDARSGPVYFPTKGRILYYNMRGQIAAAQGLVQAKYNTSWNSISIYYGMWRALRGVTRKYDVVLANHSLTAWPVACSPSPLLGVLGKVYYIQAYEPEFYYSRKGLKAKILCGVSWGSYSLGLRQVVNAPLYRHYGGIRANQWVPPGVDFSLFRRRSCLPGRDIDSPTRRKSLWTVGVIGRKEPSKGTVDALRAFEQLAAYRKDIRLSIAYGNLPAGWRHPFASVVVPANDSELSAWYRTLDIMLAPGTAQLGACHYPVLEAMASGVAVVTTGYLPADKKNAWIVPVHSPSAIAEAVEDITRASADVLAEKTNLAFEAIQDFSWEKVAMRFLAILQASRS